MMNPTNTDQGKALTEQMLELAGAMRTKAVNNVTIKSSTLDSFADELYQLAALPAHAGVSEAVTQAGGVRQNAGQQIIAERALFLQTVGDRAEASALFEARWDGWMARAVIGVGCAHPDASYSIGPTTDQRNWHCPACRASWTTFPTDEERRAAVRGKP
jgi:hypothetical protein